MSLSIITKLSKEDRIKALSKISSLEFTHSSEDIKYSLYRNLIELTLYNLNKPSTLEEIKSTLRDEFFDIIISDTLMEHILEELLEEDNAYKDDEDYCLSRSYYAEIKQRSDYARETKAGAFKYLYDGINKNYNKDITIEETKIIVDCYNEFILWFVSSRSGKISNLIVKGELKNIRYSSYNRKINEILRPINNKDLKKIVKMAIIEMFRSGNEYLIDYLYTLENKFICLQVLNLDPDCQNLKIESLSDKILFLDTNVFISLLTDRDGSSINELLDMSVKLGVKLYITQRTIDEYLKVVERSDDSYKSLVAPFWMLKEVNDPFISLFGLKNEESKPTWDNFILNLLNIEELLSQLNITYYAHPEDLSASPFYPELINEVQKCSLITRKNPKREQVAEHDAYHVLLIKELRTAEISNILGPNHWFITFDTTLPCADRFISRTFGYSDVSTPIMLVSIWIEIISQFNIRDVTKEQLTDIFGEFVSSRFSPINERVDIDTLLIVQGDWLYYKWLDEDSIIELLHSKSVVDYATKLRDAYSIGDRGLQDRLRADYQLKFNEMLGKEFNKEYTIIEQEKDQESDRRQEAEHKYETEAIFARRLRQRSGLLSVALILLGVIIGGMAAKTQEMTLVVLCLGLLAIGLAFLILAIKPENVTVNETIGVNLGR